MTACFFLSFSYRFYSIQTNEEKTSNNKLTVEAKKKNEYEIFS